MSERRNTSAIQAIQNPHTDLTIDGNSFNNSFKEITQITTTESKYSRKKRFF